MFAYENVHCVCAHFPWFMNEDSKIQLFKDRKIHKKSKIMNWEVFYLFNVEGWRNPNCVIIALHYGKKISYGVWFECMSNNVNYLND